eukprot:6120818-Pyramimonas_sp.AAC.1
MRPTFPRRPPPQRPPDREPRGGSGHEALSPEPKTGQNASEGGQPLHWDHNRDRSAALNEEAGLKQPPRNVHAGRPEGALRNSWERSAPNGCEAVDNGRGTVPNQRLGCPFSHNALAQAPRPIR